MSASTGPPAAWSEILADAVARPGVISDAYRRFWNYSVGNQLLALFECHRRDISLGPINTYGGWQKLGRQVKKGEKALTLCMPVMVKVRREVKREDPPVEGEPKSFTKFVYRPNWFVLSQTEGDPYEPQELPGWTEARALAALDILRIPFDLLDGNVQGFARGLSVSVSPIAFAPHRTLFHEVGHVLLGHTTEGEMIDGERTPRSLREVEAECVALICCESLGLPGAEHSRGYIQHWGRSEAVPERSAHRIFKAADRILRAGRSAEVPIEPVQHIARPASGSCEPSSSVLRPTGST